MDFEPSPRCTEFKERLSAFMDEHVHPAEEVYERQLRESGDPHHQPPVMEELKTRAREAGLWNMFLPDPEHGAGLSNSDYAPLAEILGRSHIASEACNCSAPDTGNMEVLHQFATPEQKDRWLAPLLEGEIRSSFAMTEPDVATSDATNIALRIERDGEEYVLNGRKWWISNALHPHCRIMIVMGKTAPDGPRHRQQSQILVPLDTPGVSILRGLPVFGYSRPRGPRRNPLRRRARAGVEPDRGRGRRLHDRPGPPRARGASTTACARSARPSGHWSRCAAARSRASRSASRSPRGRTCRTGSPSRASRSRWRAC